MHIQIADFVTIGLLIVLEGLLSADNALVMAVMVLGLPKRQHHKAARRHDRGRDARHHRLRTDRDGVQFGRGS